VVTSANVDDALGAEQVLGRLTPTSFPRLKLFWGDNKYHNHRLYGWMKEVSQGRWELEVKKRPAGSKGFVVIKKRWVVERTFAWLGRYRRHSKDYEKRTDSSVAMIQLSSINLMLNRLM
jgi:putative transposase